jgi:hypothetical protein
MFTDKSCVPHLFPRERVVTVSAVLTVGFSYTCAEIAPARLPLRLKRDPSST